MIQTLENIVEEGRLAGVLLMIHMAILMVPDRFADSAVMAFLKSAADSLAR